MTPEPSAKIDEQSAFRSSFCFHRDLESFSDFCRREWPALLIFGLGFTLFLAAFIVFVDESYFYSRVQTDALMYYLKGRAFAETGGTAARLAVNLPPFVYAAMPGILRAPFIRAMTNFDDQLRGIQLANVVIMDAVALMSTYILSWVVPRKWHASAIAFSFVFALMAPWWMQNVFMPLADAPYAALSLASVLVAIRIVSASRPYGSQKGLLIAFSLVFAAAFVMRFTEPAVLVLVAALMKGRATKGRHSNAVLALAFAAIFAVIGVLVALNWETIFRKYMLELTLFAWHAEKQSILLNLFCLAIPQQIIPAFDLGFSHAPIISVYRGQFSSNAGDVAWSALGLMLSAIAVTGAYRSRKRFAPEILMVVAVLPPLILMMPSTPRYLMTYQAFMWMWFFEGVRTLAEKIPVELQRASRHLALFVVAAALVTGLTLGVRSRGIFNSPSVASSRLDVASYIRGETDTYRPLERFMKTLPKDSAILVGESPSYDRWEAISNLNYYYPDSGLAKVVAVKAVYLVLDCGSTDTCETFGRNQARVISRLAAYGSFEYQQVFEASARKSHARVFRMRVVPDTVVEAAQKQKGNP